MLQATYKQHCGRVQLKCDGTRRRTGGSEGETGELSE